MIFRETPLPGLVQIEGEPTVDERGSFVRTFDAALWERQGLSPALVQCSVSHNGVRHTLRGLHYQSAPHAETKIVRCSRGAIFDVAVDLRPESSTFLRWYGAELTPENARMLYVPEGFAHGFLTLADDSSVEYAISTPYAPDHAGGVRWDDPAFAIDWPAPPSVLSERDRNFPDFVL